MINFAIILKIMKECQFLFKFDMSYYNYVYGITNDMHRNISISFEGTQFSDYNVQNKNDRTIQDMSIKCNLYRAFIFYRPKNTHERYITFESSHALVVRNLG